MFIHGPAVKANGQRSAALVSSLDVFPTVLDLAGVPRPAHLAGESLLPLLSDPAASLRAYVASECVGVNGEVGAGHRMVRTQRWKYVLTGMNEEYLFDEEGDPYESQNLVQDTRWHNVLGEMRDHMRAWMEQVNDRAPAPARCRAARIGFRCPAVYSCGKRNQEY